DLCWKAKNPVERITINMLDRCARSPLVGRVLAIPKLDRILNVHRPPGQIPALAILPARLFLGLTFLYAGLQKFTDPQFFSPTAPGFIGHQLSGYVHTGSPLSFLLTSLAIPQAKFFGALIALCEMLIGISTLTGLLARFSSLGGLMISLTFFLTASWSVHPYFLGADLPYAMGWLTLSLTGPGPYSLDEYFFGRFLRVSVRPKQIPLRGKHPRYAPIPAGHPENMVARASFVRGLGTAGALAVGATVVGGIAAMTTPKKQVANSDLSLTPTEAAGGVSQGKTLLGNVSSLPINSAGQYTDPRSGDPALLIHLPDGKFVAYDAVCTHNGCTVEYDPTLHQLDCPCHGAVFDPLNGGAVIDGPAQLPLTALQVTIDAKGNAYG
ncbi:MAG: TQO small subunit DoxD, partial [Chloroflexota bacterium]